MAESHAIGYQSTGYTLRYTRVQGGSIKPESWQSKVARQRGNNYQHAKLHHCSYIALLNLQHILDRIWRNESLSILSCNLGIRPSITLSPSNKTDPRLIWRDRGILCPYTIFYSDKICEIGTKMNSLRKSITDYT